MWPAAKKTEMNKVWASLFSALVISLPTQARAGALPSFWCSFTEPFITISSASNGLVYQTGLESEVLPNPKSQRHGGAVEISGKLKSGESIALSIAKGEGSDGMSEYDFPYVGQLSGAAAVTGGCVNLPKGTRLAQVVGVADGDVLNIRDRSSANGKVLGKVTGNIVWMKQGEGSGRNGWQSIAAVAPPSNERGTMGVVTGWVNSKYLARDFEKRR